MSKDRRTIRLNCPAHIERALEGVRWVANGRTDDGWLLVLTRRRTDQQNARLWAILGEIVKQRPEHAGRRMDVDDYKVMFVHGLRKEARFIPDMSGEGVIPITYSSSDLTVSEFNDLFEIIEVWCAERGITLSHHQETQQEGKAA